MALKTLVYQLLESYSYLLFSNNRYLGLFMLLLSFINPSAGVHAIVAFSAASIFSHVIGSEKKESTYTLFLYNSLLTGLAIGYLFKISILSILFTSVVGILTYLLSTSLSTVLAHYLALPILNLPFAVIASVVYLAALQYSSLFQANSSLELSYLNFAWLPVGLQGLFQSLGILLFLPYDLVGITLIILIGINSRINFLLIVMGYFSGTLFHGLLSGVPTSGFENPYSFNYILIAMALGGFFLIPSKRTYSIMISAVCISSIILDAVTVFGSIYGLPVFTLPFAVTVLLLLHTLTISRYPYITKIFRKTPEQNLEQWCNMTARSGSNLPAPRLPFSGEWSVYQGFDDNWTHQGLWRYAVDFVIKDKKHDLTYRHNGKRLEDYYCYNKPVLSPVSGTVSVVMHSLPDNPIGTVDKENNWGNHIVIYSDFGYFIEISHLANESITVVVGERVVAGQLIGRCGNSGYSPEPHIHMQVQNSAHVGAPAELFTFSQSTANGELISGEYIPTRNDTLVPQVLSRKITNTLQFILDDRIRFRHYIDSIAQKEFEVVVRMELDGTYYFEDIRLGSKLYFTQSESDFRFLSFSGNERSPLRLLFTALPSLPISDIPLTWYDSIPGSLITQRLPFYASLFKSFYHPLYSGRGTFQLNEMEISGEVTLRRLFNSEKTETTISLDPEATFRRIRVASKGETHELVVL